MADPPEIRRPPRPPLPRSDDRADDEVWSELRELRNRVSSLEMLQAQSRSKAKEEAMAVKEAIAAHLRQVERLGYEVRQVLEKIEAQDRREEEREAVRAELKAEQEAERRRVQEEFDRLTENTGKFLTVKEKHASISDASIDGPHRRRMAVLTLVTTLLGGLVTLAVSSALSHCH